MSDLMDSFRLDGKVALVTGATYGIGMAIAEALGEAGAKIAFNARHADKVAEAVRLRVAGLTRSVQDLQNQLAAISIALQQSGIDLENQSPVESIQALNGAIKILKDELDRKAQPVLVPIKNVTAESLADQALRDLRATKARLHVREEVPFFTGRLIGVDEDWLFDDERSQHALSYAVLLVQADVTDFESVLRMRDEAARFGSPDHIQGGPVLDRSGRIVAFEFQQHDIGAVSRQALETHQWSVSDKFFQATKRRQGHGQTNRAQKCAW